MTQSQRKFTGAILLVVSIAVWAVLATWVYLALLMTSPWWVHIPYFAVAGAGWLLPSMWLIRWMAAPDR